MSAEGIAEFTKILNDLKAKRFAPVYYLFGEEHFYIDALSDYIEQHVLDEAEKGFNQTIFYGKDADIQAVTSTLRRFPMMAPYQVVIIKEAQAMDKIDELATYFEKPVPSTILVICNKSSKLDKRTRLYKLLQQHIVFESKKLYPDKIPGWITGYLKEKNFTISPRAAQLIADAVGTDLSKLVNELNKLIIDKHDTREISDTDVEFKIGISKEFNIFELISAIANKNQSRAFYIAHHLGRSKSFSLIAAVINLSGFFSKAYIVKASKVTDRRELQSRYGLNYFQANDCLAAVKNYSSEQIEHYIRLMHEYDLKSKGVNSVNTGQDELLKEMLVKMW
jgi:DNA polymerase-3 subunit delta